MMQKIVIPYEDLRTYTLVDPSGKVLVEKFKGTYTEVNAAYMGWLYAAKSFVGDYKIEFEVCCTGHLGDTHYNGDWYCLAVMDDATPYLATYCGGAILNEASGVGPKLGIFQGGYAGQYPEVNQAINLGQRYFCTLERVAGTLRLYIYLYSSRTVLLATLTSPTVLTTAGTQLFACSGGSGDESGWVSGYTRKILVG